MKSKKFSKKLALNKSTIASLNNGTMHGVKGGVVTEVGETCPLAQCPIKSVWVCIESRARPCA